VYPGVGFAITPAMERAIARNRRQTEAVNEVRRYIATLDFGPAMLISEESLMRRAIEAYQRITDKEERGT
jgi:hypothetical protein